MTKRVALVLYVVASILLVAVGLLFPPVCFGAAFLSVLIGVWVFAGNIKIKLKTTKIVVAIAIVSSLVVQWPIAYSQPISGQVKDTLTGEPISNAIFECEWVKYTGSIGGAVGREFGRSYAVTDKDGRYKISGRLTIHPFSYTAERHITLRHPLYESGKYSYGPYGKLHSGGRFFQFRLGTLRNDIKLIKLEDKYKNYRKIAGACDIWDGVNGFSSYIRTAILADVCKTIDLQSFPDAWIKLLMTQPEHHCKTKGLEMAQKWREEIDKHEIFESIGSQWIKVYGTPASNPPSAGMSAQVRQAEKIRQKLGKGCYAEK